MVAINLDYTSGIPIYVQIKEAIRNAVVSGAYSKGTQLPTVRQMAVELKINANTVSRAYTELERDGVLASRQGRGTFVHLEKEIDPVKLERLEQLVDGLLTAANELGFSEQEIASIFDRIIKNKTHNHAGG
ncbi:MAG: GntR family transcriptional regulator [Sporomusaceae bacterium]|nr:GntR family transcriptional regulator [Sporomusaceae bacterium]